MAFCYTHCLHIYQVFFLAGCMHIHCPVSHSPIPIRSLYLVLRGLCWVFWWCLMPKLWCLLVDSWFWTSRVFFQQFARLLVSIYAPKAQPTTPGLLQGCFASIRLLFRSWDVAMYHFPYQDTITEKKLLKDFQMTSCYWSDIMFLWQVFLCNDVFCSSNEHIFLSLFSHFSAGLTASKRI